MRQKVKICTEAGSAYYQLEAELELLYFYSAGFTAGFLIGGVQDIQPHLVISGCLMLGMDKGGTLFIG